MIYNLLAIGLLFYLFEICQAYFRRNFVGPLQHERSDLLSVVGSPGLKLD